MNAIEGPSECLMENVADPRSAAQLRRFNISGRALNGRAVSAGEFRDDLEQSLALVRDVLAVGVQERLELGDHDVDARLHG